ncbi:DUF58 domain-containing protein [Arthrobacter sp. StoSoilB5]|jgi:uncharacterized protein (DUF58 family)|uniref:DUF58 domain-containing protein n=1 Tax=Arthrobacter sp. StoSoilB5 TaxID=2830992 RepID=UPI001CC4A51D|nr:DUF58 domain-containing protein [Arthrobacter sp. StoSoilB5]BCW44143.1 hypothetical protein StoSoilB5_13270 [Arthrobacter sp. StoSoilB5]
MALVDRLPKHLFTSRGWGLLAAGVVSLVSAHIMGRRDLLTLAVFLLILPLVALAGVRVLKPKFQVYREFNPSTVETSTATTVRLAVARSTFSTGHVIMEEQLPPRFGDPPAFRFPARSATGGTSRYEYHLRSGKRGQFRIGPVTAEFSDPFGLSLRRHSIDDGDLLTVTPAAVELPVTGLAGARGNDGVTATRIRANPSDDDIMTREYRHGDPMRRVHWPATARHGQLMVRQEESVTTPEATIILDQRFAAFASSSGSVFGLHDDDSDLVTSPNFEWAVTAAMSISAHLAERNYSLRLLDAYGSPAFIRSRSAPDPGVEEFNGVGGLHAIAEGLAAIELSGPRHHWVDHHRAEHQRPEHQRAGQNTSGHALRSPDPTGSTPNRHSGASEIPGQENVDSVFEDRLMDKLAAHRLRGPLLALLGHLTLAEAKALAPAAGYGANAFALVVLDPPGNSGSRNNESGNNEPRNNDEILETLRQGGWKAVSVTSKTPLTAAWSSFDEGGIVVAASAAMDVRRGAAVPR